MQNTEPTTAIDAQTSVNEAITRLYICPLTSAILKAILPTQANESSSKVTLQCSQTFPESPFGFITLPTTAAQALKKKFHGAYLKGSKMKVEEARPEKKRKREAEKDEQAAADEKKSTKRNKKHAKLEEGVLPAVELSEGRHVKRGWTGTADAKSSSKKDRKVKEGKSKSRDRSKVTFRTQLPDDQNSPKGDKSDQPEKRTKSKRRVELKESEKTTSFPSFLKQNKATEGGGAATTYVEGKGWVDAEGNVVEAVSSRKSGRNKKAARPLDEAPATAPVTKDQHPSKPSNGDDAASDNSSSSTLSPSSASSDSESADEDTTPIPHTHRSSSTTGRSTKSPPIPSTEAAPTPTSSAPETLPEPSPPLSPPSKPLDPLTALFKRPSAPPTTTTSPAAKGKRRPPPVPIKTAFAFSFEEIDHAAPNSNEDEPANETNEPIDESTIRPPATPFTRQDRFARSIRSAAPTPDTAAIGRRFSWRDFGGREEDEEDEEASVHGGGERGPVVDGMGDVERASRELSIAAGIEGNGIGGDAAMDEEQTAAGQQEEIETGTETGTGQNEFEKRFYEQRGEYNKAWKARRREARKEVRQAENRRVGVGW